LGIRGIFEWIYFKDMYLSKQEITQALQELGQLALEQGEPIELMVVGGALMVLAYDARTATKDVDALILAPPQSCIGSPIS
jgi:hypothetical protein